MNAFLMLRAVASNDPAVRDLADRCERLLQPITDGPVQDTRYPKDESAVEFLAAAERALRKHFLGGVPMPAVLAELTPEDAALLIVP